MDSLTQVVLGAAVGELVLGRKVGNRAILWGAIGGTIPDLDVLTKLFVDDLRANEVHRGITHSVLVSQLLAPLFARWIKRHERSFLAVFLALLATVFVTGASGWITPVVISVITLALIARVLRRTPATDTATVREWSRFFWWVLVTHALLDCHTTWGTQLFWPFPLRVSYNTIFVVDPFYTLPLLVCVVAVCFLRRTDARRRRLNALGLVLSSAYLLLTLGTKYVAHTHAQASLARQGMACADLTTRPSPFNTILWNANVDCGDHYALGTYSLLDTRPAIAWVEVPKRTDLLGPLAQHEQVQRLIALAEGHYVIQQRHDSLLFCDLRFGQLGEPGPDRPFVFSYALIPAGDELHVVRVPSPRMSGQQVRQWLAAHWQRIKGV